MRGCFLAVLTAGVLPAANFCAHAAETQELRYDRDIRPILSDNCFRCHGPEAKSRKAKLRLDVREVALEKEAFVPGKPDESEMIRRLTTTNEDDHMPPAIMHKTVTRAQIDLIRRWITARREIRAALVLRAAGAPGAAGCFQRRLDAGPD
jgi:mono/diheme cytochrome c family protein